ncbi:SPOR domain-containing protein [Pseudaestuariivita rosea]|uniref:SPOR domain-containing protein n=1 Tax=Pseudaestuariivita rosea TaxID=2763263 RepID=UPI001ABAC656|nr:SPOR domain-containing protein [Pseudaestuariivita rosea]
MAEMTSPNGDTPGVQTLVNWAGAMMSLALIAGVSIWGYNLIQRDMSGVPVVRALEGPMRVQPDDPGGRPAEHQGLAVNAIAAEDGSDDLADRVVLAPAPVDISGIDPVVPRQSMAEADDADLVVAETTTHAVLTEPLQPAAPPAQDRDASSTDGPSEEELRALVEQVASQTEPLEPPEQIVGGLGRSLRPQLRPASLNVSPRPVAPIGAPQEVDAYQIPFGTTLVQLAALETPQDAEAEWDRLSRRLTGFFDDKGRVIQKAERAGRTFYRLRAMGFDDLSDARRFCSAIIAEGEKCIPVTTRH